MFGIFLLIVVFLFFICKKNYINFIPNKNIKYKSIDCIRGYLSLGVYFYHFTIWIQYLKTNSWKKHEFFYQVNNLGDFSVYIFFMITAFLFFGKFLDCSFKNFNWKNLLISRIFRLVPMYIFYVIISSALFFMFFRDELLNYQNIKNYFDFFLKFFDFSILNIIKNEAYNIFGILWTLRIELIFYLFLPVIFLLYKVTKSTKIASIILIFISTIFYFSLIQSYQKNSLCCLLLGILICFVARHKKLTLFFSKKYVGFLVIIMFLMNLFLNKYYLNFSIFIIGIFFIIVTIDNPIILNILNKKISYFLSIISYSIYLNHGIVIFIFFKIIGYELIINMNYFELLLLSLAILTIVVIVSEMTFRLIENPLIALGKKLKS